MESHSVPFLFYALAGLAVLSFGYWLRRILVIRQGKPETLNLTWGEMIRNALLYGVAQKKVYDRRFSFASVMHALIGWGFIELFFATTVDFFVARGWFTDWLPGLDTPWFAFLNDLGGACLGLGLLLAIFRRLALKPEKLPNDHFTGRGAWLGDLGVLLLLLLLVIGGFIAEAARLATDAPPTAQWSWIGYALIGLFPERWLLDGESFLWWFHALTALGFIAILPMTKMFHALAVIANVAVTDRDKIGRIPAMNVSKLMEDPDMDPDAVSLGAETVGDFTWKQLLNTVSCTECARCTTVCPANQTGKPLSPMKIITDIRRAAEKRNGKLVGGAITEEELWSCTTCGACTDECPVLIDHVPIFTEFRRHLVLAEGKPPLQANDSLEKTMNSGNPWGLSDRLKWAADGGLDLPLMAEKKKADVLYWVGCAGAFDPRNQQIARSLAAILKKAGVDFAILGNEEMCTGDSARRLGEEYLFETMALQNIETLGKYNFERIVTACPHCFHTLKNEYGDLGGQYQVVHHAEFINELVSSGRLTLKAGDTRSLTYHDPCYLGRHNGIYETPRMLLNRVTANPSKIVEMKNSRSKSFCCGAGGGNMWHEIETGTRTNLARFDEAAATGAEAVVTACSFCAIMMDDAAKVRGKDQEIAILDIAEVTAASLMD